MKIEIWDNTEENKMVHSFELSDVTQKLSIHVPGKDTVYFDVNTNKITLVAKKSVSEVML